MPDLAGVMRLQLVPLFVDFHMSKASAVVVAPNPETNRYPSVDLVIDAPPSGVAL